ncbi:LPS O-antigen length regulator [Ferrimonas sediminicola]|uniref:LPS O-antigen length regulator n=1 Tax=Ferrimonas sediminicola TaxID=2569538 RepID=A0A4U1B911_9GAMM|nr:Wzz/FepE/Etk N-terminal domain-containing protein [Ferrimonas sediminicola]TKB46468.1 LPS O-antigen length regulator [Ferrimonas sediminicola]
MSREFDVSPGKSCSNVQSYSNDFQEIDLKEIWVAICSGKKIITIVFSIILLSSVFVAVWSKDIYKAEALLAPVSNDESSRLSSLTGQFGTIAAMAGINLGAGSNVDKTALAMEVFKSRDFLRGFIDRNDILIELMASESWDEETHKLNVNEDVYDMTDSVWVRKVTGKKEPKPSSQEAIKELLKKISIEQDKNTSLIKVSVKHISPVIAKRWVDLLVKDINENMRARDIDESVRYINYLNKRIEMTKVSDMRAILYRLIEEQSKILMFAESRDEYIFKTVDAALIPEEPNEPRRFLIVMAGSLLALFISLMTAIAVYFLKKQ